jgi:uncharacterized protein YdhG (YjbR/CyaY superfamily)
MRKTKSGKRSSKMNSRGNAKTVDQYFARLQEPARSTLTKIRGVVLAAAPPEATETISYRIPAVKYKGMLVWYAAFSDHCSLFPTAAVIEEFKSELKGYQVSKGTIQFPVNKPLPAALVRKMVKWRVKQNESMKKH